MKKVFATSLPATCYRLNKENVMRYDHEVRDYARFVHAPALSQISRRTTTWATRLANIVVGLLLLAWIVKQLIK